MSAQTHVRVTDELIDQLCSFGRFDRPGSYLHEKIRGIVQEYIDRYGSITGVATTDVNVKKVVHGMERNYGGAKHELESGKVIFAYKDVNTACGCSSSEIAVRDRGRHIVNHKQFDDYFCCNV